MFSNASRHFPDDANLDGAVICFSFVVVPNLLKIAVHSNPAKNLPFKSG
jgi:hypothetical protein